MHTDQAGLELEEAARAQGPSIATLRERTLADQRRQRALEAEIEWQRRRAREHAGTVDGPIDRRPSLFWCNYAGELKPDVPKRPRCGELRQLTTGEVGRLVNFNGFKARPDLLERLERMFGREPRTRVEYARMFITTRKAWVRAYFRRLNEAARRG